MTGTPKCALKARIHPALDKLGKLSLHQENGKPGLDGWLEWKNEGVKGNGGGK